MDFTLDEEQTAIQELAARILGERSTPERLREVEATDDRFDRTTWEELAKADLLGLCVPEAHGGGGYGELELALLLEQVGRTTAALPALPTLALGALPLARFGTDDQQAAWLPRVARGDVVLTAALAEGFEPLPPAVPATEAVPTAGGGWRLAGTKALVPAAHLATRVLVPARTGTSSSTVFLVDPSAPGVSLERNLAANLEVVSTLRLDGVEVGPDDVLGEIDGGAEVVGWTVDRGVLAWCAVQAGVCEAALRTTATYTSERRQFGSPIATFQAVAHRAADAYVDTEAIRLTTHQAAWRLASGLAAAEELAIAKYWASEGAQRIVHAAQHLHGGIGVDTDYPVHRCFRWAKHAETSLGGGTAHLRRLGALLAAG